MNILRRILSATFAVCAFVTSFVVVSRPTGFESEPLVSTFSIVAIDPSNGDVGVAVQSKFPNVRPIVPWAKAGVGAIATQSFANVSYGPRGLALMENGATAEQALRALLGSDSGRDKRQVGIVDAKGNSASWSGNECFDWAGGIVGAGMQTTEISGGKGVVIAGNGFAAQGNILVGKETVEALARVFKETKGSLADRLVAALVAGGKAGGDRRGEQSAALLVKRKAAGYDSTFDDLVDISIYDHAHPLQELQRLYQLHTLYFYKSHPENLMPISPEVCKELQGILKDKSYKGREFYSGAVNGAFDEATKKGLQDFMGWENYDVRIRDDDKIDKEVLTDIRRLYKEFKSKKN